MEGSFIFSNKAIKSGNIDLQEWLGEASKEERIEMAKQIADTVEKSDDEIEYILILLKKNSKYLSVIPAI
jgi:hypothetical protein